MKIITVANQKGGVGKTTITFNMALAAMRDDFKTLIVDADPQRSITDVSITRFKNGIMPHVQTTYMVSDRIHVNLPRKFKAYDLAIIDSGRQDSRAFRSAIAAADLLVIPVLPSAVDIWSSQQTIKIAKDIQAARPDHPLQIYCLLNQQVRNTVIGAGAVEALGEIGVPMFKMILHFRTAYSRSLGDGKSVLEYMDKQSIYEMEMLWEEVCVSLLTN